MPIGEGQDVQLIRVADRPDMPWKNGGGTTRELLSAPGGDQGFVWRISVATIAQDGPFSRFPGITRTLVGLSGIGTLRISDRLAEVGPGTILDFDGQETVSAIIGTGPLRVLNVMTATSAWRQQIRAPRPVQPAPWRDERPHMFIALREGTRPDLQPGDLIRDIGADDVFDGITAIEIRLLR